MQSTGRNNYYEILELPTGAPAHEVIKAYERACVAYSGDNPAIYSVFSNQEADELLIMVEEAYQILSNSAYRAIYDQRLLSGRSSLNELTYDSIVETCNNSNKDKKIAKKSLGYKVNSDLESEILTQDQWTGTFLKKVREYKCISVERMSEITKINSWYITAIERNDPSALPAIVFVRGYIIQISRALGIDDKKVADSYMKIYKNALGK
jgi:curved DNA-binding protein CbpA